MTFIRVPRNGVPKELRDKIEAALPSPLEVPGWEFDGYVWRNITQINTKDKNGYTDNTVRISGTGDNDTLRESLKRGLDVSELTPSLYVDENEKDSLLNGFNRHKQLPKAGYKEWIFAEYKINKKTATEFQLTHEDFLDDFRAAANKGNGTKVITPDEILELGRKRFENRKDRSKTKVKEWIDSLDLNLSPQRSAAIASKVAKDFERRGVVDSYTRTEAEQWMADQGIGGDVLNTIAHEGDKTRVLRLFVHIMENFINNKSTYGVALFDSQASNHEQIDSHRETTLKAFKEIDELIMDYAAKRVTNLTKDPFVVLGAIPQKIGDITEVTTKEEPLVSPSVLPFPED